MAAPPLYDALLDFGSKVSIDSKETGVGPFKPYRSQHILFDTVSRALASDCHDITILKARQLGISTGAMMIVLFWALCNAGMQAALVTDRDSNKERFRSVMSRYVGSLPPEWRDTEIIKHNRDQLICGNGSALDYLVAGVRRSASDLGRSRAFNLLHATECANWGSGEGVASLRSALAETNPHRLYIWESTANGYNWYYDQWKQAERDPRRIALFIGAWAKEDYALRRGSKEFKFYWTGSLSDDETARIAKVRALYNVKITPEQIAWYRMKAEEMSAEMMQQEFPWTADEAFVASGASYFPSRRLIEMVDLADEHPAPFKGWRYELGTTFMDTKLVPVADPDEADLRVYEEPSPNGVYAIGVDPSYARSSLSDFHAIQVLRCYADRAVQVAEYCTRRTETYQIAWVLAHLAGCYRNCIVNLEITGPGAAVMSELRALRQTIDMGPQAAEAEERGMRGIVGAIRWYLYKRPDTMGAGYVYNWQTNSDNKKRMLTMLRDSVILRGIEIRSHRVLTEMQRMVQMGDHIEADAGYNDDLTISLGLAHIAWADWHKPRLLAMGETWARAHREGPANNSELLSMVVSSFFNRLGERDRRAARR